MYEAEAVGLTLAAKLIAMEWDLTFHLSISIENQVVIQSGESFTSNPGSYLIDHFCSMLKCIAKDHVDFDITLRWVPGHSNVHSNEEADKHAKQAAEGKHQSSPHRHLPHFLQHNTLPLSISTLQEVQHNASHPQWEQIWRKSPHYARTNQIDPKLLQHSFVKLTARFPKCLTDVYMVLHTQHAPLWSLQTSAPHQQVTNSLLPTLSWYH